MDFVLSNMAGNSSTTVTVPSSKLYLHTPWTTSSLPVVVHHGSLPTK